MADKKKLASTFLNMVLVLSIIALVSALALAFTYTATQEARKEVKVQKTLKAIKQVLPEFDNNPNDEKYTVEGFDGLEFYPATKGGESVGTAIKSYSDNGFNERIWIMVGFDKDNKIYQTHVVEQKETPGLGTKMTEPKFKSQFDGKDPASFKLKVKKDGGDIDAITAATITSRAFCDATDRAYKALLKGGKK
jgi:Na+-translocating ferredoxin:NAD+ oxidoreductase subunit G